MSAFVVFVFCLFGPLWAAYPHGVPEQNWPMLAHDPGRGGATSAEIRPPFERKWYRLFADEGLMAGVQPVVAQGKVLLGTMRGALYAIDAETGKDVWVFRSGGPILHTCAVGGGKVFFGNAQGRVYAVNLADGSAAWSIQTGSAVWNAPVFHDGVMVIGSRDGNLYAIDADNGEVKWKTPTGGPILSSPALDVKAGTVYVAGEDMRVYAFSLRDGRGLWRSDKLPGVSFRGYHPVVAPDGSVLVTVTPFISLESFEPILLDMVKEIFGDFASWRHTKEENQRLREKNFEQMAKPGTYEAQLSYIRKRLTEQPIYQTLFVLDPKTGKQKFVSPIVYAESMNGVGAPPIVTPDGKVIVKFQALLRSRYEHYSPFLNVGYLDTSTGDITPIMDQTRTYGWHDSLLLVHDEQCQLTVAGRVLINTHQDNVNAMDLDTLRGYEEPFCRNIHEPKPGEAVGIWAKILRNEMLPIGKEWLARGTAVYGGGSVIDTPVSVAGDSFYYIPTHEINAGAAVIAYRMRSDGKAGRSSDLPATKLTADEWEKVQAASPGPWDWDTLQMPRLNHLVEALPGKVPGTAQSVCAGLTEQALELVAKIADGELDRFIWEAPVVRFQSGTEQAGLKAELGRYVRELISQQWQPLIFPCGKHPREAYRFFAEPAETLYTLARAYNYIDDGLRADVRRYVAQLSAPGCPLELPVGQASFNSASGAVRSSYDVPAENLFRAMDDIKRNEVARLYPLWLWAHVTGDWSRIEESWKDLRGSVERPPNDLAEDCHNGHLAGLIAYCRMAAHIGDETAIQQGVAAARKYIRERVAYELAHTKGGLITQVPVSRSIFARWRHLTPEVGRLCAAYAGQTHEHLMAVYVDYHRPTWFLTWNTEMMWRNESPFAFPTMAAEIFAARALILAEPAGRLTGFLDIPWCKADLFYIQKLVLCIEAHGNTAWQQVLSRP